MPDQTLASSGKRKNKDYKRNESSFVGLSKMYYFDKLDEGRSTNLVSSYSDDSSSGNLKNISIQ